MKEYLSTREREITRSITAADRINRMHHPLDNEAIKARRDLIHFHIQLAEVLRALSVLTTVKEIF